jgi:SAM-dependent methyltransferase
VLQPGALLAGIGAGTEETTFVLASKGCVVFPTDRYLERTPWSDVAPATMMVCPSKFSHYDYPRGSVIPIHTDARVLALPSDFFDGVYSAGSIEHFGSLEAVSAAAEEMGRILKPGGVAVLSTEFRLDGPNDKRWFSDDCILFTPELLQEHIIGPSGLELIGDVQFDTSKETYDGRVVLSDFLTKVSEMRTLEDKRNTYPNLILFHDGYLFCSVHLALRKPHLKENQASSYSKVFESAVAADATRAAGILTAQIAEWTAGYRDRPSAIGQLDSSSQSRAIVAEAELARILKSRSFRITKPLRQAAARARGIPALRVAGIFVMRTLRRLKRSIDALVN